VTHVFAFVEQLLHIALVLAAAPTLSGIIRWARAQLVGRVGSPILQPWRDLARLLRKQPVMAESASAVSAVAPLVAAAAVATAAILVPSFTLGMTLAPFADLLTIAGLLIVARTAIALAGMDAGSAAGGIGASRTMVAACLSEPALVLAIFALGLLAGSSNLDLIAAMQQDNGLDWHIGAGLALTATALVAVVDAADGPVSATAPIALEVSGRDMAAIDAMEALRLLVWLNLIVAMFLPFGMAPAGAGIADLGLGLVCWVAKLLALAGAIALLRVMTGRLEPRHVPRVLGAAVLLGLLAVVFLFAGVGTV
jgi:formate hydrogenlyase subunit 4